MKQLHVRLGGLLCLVVGFLGQLAPAFGQAKKESVHQLAIYNGELRTVHYFSKGLTEADKAKVRKLERAENDLAFASYNKALAEHPIGPGYVRPYCGWCGCYGYPFYFGDIVPMYFSNLNYILSDSAPLYAAYMPYYGFGYGAYATPAVYFGARPIVGAAYMDRTGCGKPLTRILRKEVSRTNKRLDDAVRDAMRSPVLRRILFPNG
jgi:hypothetical protein